MSRLTRHLRLIHLLLLFQILGGPAVLCGVMGLVRLAGDRQLTLEQHAVRALERVQRLEQGEGEPAVLSHHDESSHPSMPEAPAPEKEGKVQLMGISEDLPPAFKTPLAAGMLIICRHDPVVITRSQVPLLRPPRLG